MLFTTTYIHYTHVASPPKPNHHNRHHHLENLVFSLFARWTGKNIFCIQKEEFCVHFFIISASSQLTWIQWNPRTLFVRSYFFAVFSHTCNYLHASFHRIHRIWIHCGTGLASGLGALLCSHSFFCAWLSFVLPACIACFFSQKDHSSPKMVYDEDYESYNSRIIEVVKNPYMYCGSNAHDSVPFLHWKKVPCPSTSIVIA